MGQELDRPREECVSRGKSMPSFSVLVASDGGGVVGRGTAASVAVHCRLAEAPGDRRNRPRHLPLGWGRRHRRRLAVAIATALASLLTAGKLVLQGRTPRIGTTPDASSSSSSSLSRWRIPSPASFRDYDPARSLLVLRSSKVDEGTTEYGEAASSDSAPRKSSASHNQPPTTACFGSARSVMPYLTQREGRDVARAWAERQPRLRLWQLQQHPHPQQQQQRQQQQPQPRPIPASPKALVNKGELLRMLLQEAENKGRLLLTVQIGGHDGKSNDPMYNALVRDNPGSGTGTPNGTVAHWLPVVAEPVGPNFGRLLETYQDIHRNRSLPCQLPVRWAMSYGNEGGRNSGGGGAGAATSCPFYRFNNDASAPESCRDKPEWVKTQLGTISEANGRLRHALHWECIVVDPVPCGTMHDLLVHQWGSDAARRAMSNLMVLQVDVEGYEEVLLPAVMKEADHMGIRLPPVIHYESKILKYWDRRDKTSRLSTIRDALRQRGYDIYEDLEDDLAIQVDGE